MNQSHSQVNGLLIIVAILAIVGGLTIVIVTSPKSWELGPAAWFQGPAPSLTPVPPSATPLPTDTATPTTVPPTRAPTSTLGPTATRALPTETAPVEDAGTLTATVDGTPATPIPAVTSNTLPEDVYGLAVVSLTAGATSARLRDLPNGEQIIAAVPNGTDVTVLFGRVEANDNMWVQVRLESGTEGWMAEFLLRYTVRRP